jgi:hypothetical protein
MAANDAARWVRGLSCLRHLNGKLTALQLAKKSPCAFGLCSEPTECNSVLRFSALMMEAASRCETSVNLRKTARHDVPDGSHFVRIIPPGYPTKTDVSHVLGRSTCLAHLFLAGFIILFQIFPSASSLHFQRRVGPRSYRRRVYTICGSAQFPQTRQIN